MTDLRNFLAFCGLRKWDITETRVFNGWTRVNANAQALREESEYAAVVCQIDDTIATAREWLAPYEGRQPHENSIGNAS